MPTLHPPQPAAAHVGGGHDSWRFQRILFSLLCPPHQVRAAHAECAGGDVGRPDQARSQASARTNHSSHWPTGCRLSVAEQALAVRYRNEPMSWEG